MTTKGLAVVAVGLGVLTVVGVLLPWTAFPPEAEAALAQAREMLRDFSRELPGAAPARMPEPDLPNRSGTSAGFNGTGILILAIVGGLAAGVFALARPRTVPVSARGLLGTAVVAFGLGFVLTLADVLKDWGGASKAFGIWLTLLASLGGAVAALLAFRRAPAAAPPPPAPPPPAA